MIKEQLSPVVPAVFMLADKDHGHPGSGAHFMRGRLLPLISLTESVVTSVALVYGLFGICASHCCVYRNQLWGTHHHCRCLRQLSRKIPMQLRVPDRH